MRTLFPSALLTAICGTTLACLCCLLLLLPLGKAWSSTSAERKDEKAKIEQRIKKHRINISKLQLGIEKQQDDIEKNQNQERELLAELQEIDDRLSEHREKLEVLEQRIKTQRNLIVTKNTEIERVETRKNKVQLHLQKRIQAYYKMGNIGFINVTFSARSLPELLNFHESFQFMIKYDQEVIITYRQTLNQLRKTLETLEIEQALLETFIEQNKEEQQKIKRIKDEKEELLSRIQTQTRLQEKAIAELDQAARSLTASLQKLEKKEERFKQTFLYSKGKIPPPVSGTIVAGFKEEIMNRLGIKMLSQGIAIKAPNGSIVRAVHDGVVTFAGYLRGYGNTVIVNHGYQYYSICSRIERILAEKGQKVSEGSEIGVMGDTATLLNEGLYFEIRKDSTPLDPLEWLDRSKLQAKK